MNFKKGSKNAIENRGGSESDRRGEPVVVMVKGKRKTVFEKDGSYFDKKGEVVTL